MKGAGVDAGLGAPVCLHVDLTASRSFSAPRGSMYAAFFELQKAATFRFSSLYKLKLRETEIEKKMGIYYLLFK